MNRIINLGIAFVLFAIGLFFNTFDTELGATTIGPVLITSGLYFLIFSIKNFNLKGWFFIESNTGDERERYIKSLAKSKTLDIVMLLLIPTFILSRIDILDLYTVTLTPIISILSYQYLYKYYSEKY